jgi:hypothetical protein
MMSTVNKTLDGPAKPNGLGILLGLNSSGKPIYAGTVPSADVAKRRAKNRLARKARRINR